MAGTMAQPPDAVSAKIAPYTGRTSLLIFGGAALILVNVLTSGEGMTIAHAVTPLFPAPNQTANHVSVLDIGLQIGGLLLLVIIASVSDDGGSFAMLFLLALWLGWLYTHRAFFAGVAQIASGAPAGK